MYEKMNTSLAFLRDKYGCASGEIVSGPDGAQLLLPGNKTVALLPWRVERRFVELKKIIDSQTLEDVSTFRFASFSSGGDCVRTAARELDLAVYLSGANLIQLFAVRNGDAACNILARLNGGISASVECGINLPPGAEILDRHEIIAKRGVASDRGVDTQVPQSSIYEWTQSGNSTFTDVDTELFGLPNEQIWIVRAAFAVLMEPALADVWNKAAEDMKKYASAIVRSGAENQPVIL